MRRSARGPLGLDVTQNLARWQLCEGRMRSLYRLGNPFLLEAAERTMVWLADPWRRAQVPPPLRGRLLVAIEYALRRARGWRDAVHDETVAGMLATSRREADEAACRELLDRGLSYLGSAQGRRAALCDRAALWVCLGATQRRLDSLTERLAVSLSIATGPTRLTPAPPPP